MLGVFASREARELGHGTVGTDHFLLAVLHEPEAWEVADELRRSGDRAAQVLQSLGASLSKARRTVREVRNAVGALPRTAPEETAVPFSAEAKRGLEASFRLIKVRRLIRRSIPPTS